MTSESKARPKRPSITLPQEIRVVNVGLPVFGEAVRAQGASAVDVEWRIPAGGSPELVAALNRLFGRAAGTIDEANREVLRRLDTGTPRLTRIATAADVVPGMGPRTILHPGPPLARQRFCDPLRRSVRAAIMAEGWARDSGGAERLLAAGDVELEPANHHACVLPMATALGPTGPVLVVENPQGNNVAFSAINQGPGKVAWFGVEAPEAVERLRWLRDTAAPVLRATLEESGPIDVFSLVAQGLQMGDDAHMRTQATTNLLIRHLLPYLVGRSGPGAVEVARFLSGNHLFFLNVGMAAAKAVTDWAAGVAGSSLVVGMARNGTTFGIRLAGDDQWFIADAPPVEDALYHPGFGPDAAAPDIGDSAVLELIGLGGAAAAASPAVAAFVGGTMQDAVARTETVARICAGRSSRFTLPILDGRGSPLGVDVRKVCEYEVVPSINTGILHASDGVGQVGAGVAAAPLACFRDALVALSRRFP